MPKSRISSTHAGKMVRVYHVSPEANLQVLRGFYSRGFGGKGLFVGPLKAILHSWAAFVAGKKTQNANFNQITPGYKSLTLYTLEIPAFIYAKVRTLFDETFDDAYQELLSRGYDQTSALMALYSSYKWDDQYFIPENYLKFVRIAGRKTLPTRALTRDVDVPINRSVNLEKEALKVQNTNPAAKLYLNLKGRLQEIEFSKSKKDLYERKMSQALVGQLPWLFYSSWDKSSSENLAPSDKGTFMQILEEWKRMKRKLYLWEEPPPALGSRFPSNNPKILQYQRDKAEEEQAQRLRDETKGRGLSRDRARREELIESFRKRREELLRRKGQR